MVEKLVKITAKSKKTRQSSKTDISDFKLKCGKMFLTKFRRKLHAAFWSMLSGKKRKITLHPPSGF